VGFGDENGEAHKQFGAKPAQYGLEISFEAMAVKLGG